MSIDEIRAYRTAISGKSKADQIRATGAKYVVAPCTNCKKTGGQEALQCAHCDAYVPVAIARGKAGVTKCPGCGNADPAKLPTFGDSRELFFDDRPSENRTEG